MLRARVRFIPVHAARPSAPARRERVAAALAGLLVVAAIAASGLGFRGVDPVPVRPSPQPFIGLTVTFSPDGSILATDAPTATVTIPYAPASWSPSASASPSESAPAPVLLFGAYGTALRPVPWQSAQWLALKSAGRLSVVDGQIVTLPPLKGALVDPATGKPVPSAYTLDSSWARWIIEPLGAGADERGNVYVDDNYWRLCGPGAGAVALFYWQQRTGVPNVAAAQGYFLEPYGPLATSAYDLGGRTSPGPGATPSPSPSVSPSASPSASPSPSPSAPGSPSPSPAPSASASPSATGSPSPSPTPGRTATPSPAPTASSSGSPSVSPSASASSSASPSSSASSSSSPSSSPSASGSTPGSAAAGASPSGSGSPGPSASQSATPPPAAGPPEGTPSARASSSPGASGSVPIQTWPSPGPVFLGGNGVAQWKGTYWSGTDTVNGYTANGRGYLMYLATAMTPPGWIAAGVLNYVKDDGTALFPTDGTYPGILAAAMNWEASGHRQNGWVNTWYTLVTKADPAFAADLRTAVMADVGRDHVGVVAEVDTFHLPNWQGVNGADAVHSPHSITIVGYDNTANPPTYTYLDTCGQACNGRSGNVNGGVYTISQADLVKAMQDEQGSGFIW